MERNEKGKFIKGHKLLPGSEKGWFKKGQFVGIPLSPEHRMKLSIARKGKPLSETHRKALLLRPRRTLSAETRLKISLSQRAEKGSNWQGGITPIHQQIRHGVEYRDWRKSVLKRDNYTCQKCKKRGGQLHADHIKPFSLYPEERFNLANGQTLCFPCHRTTDSFAGKIRSMKKKLDSSRQQEKREEDLKILAEELAKL